jgi:hypothetical protein
MSETMTLQEALAIVTDLDGIEGLSRELRWTLNIAKGVVRQNANEAIKRCITEFQRNEEEFTSSDYARKPF